MLDVRRVAFDFCVGAAVVAPPPATGLFEATVRTLPAVSGGGDFGSVTGLRCHFFDTCLRDY
jgi:hypothetical protein